MKSPQTIAAAWHWADVGLTGLAFGFALVGLYGHYRLRKSYQRWHDCQPA